VKAGGGTDGLGLPLESVAVVRHRVFEIVEGREVLIDERLVAERPQMLGGLQFGRVGRQGDPMEAFRDLDLRAGLVTGLIKDQDDALALAGADGAGEIVAGDAHDRGIDAGGKLPLLAPRGRMDETEHVEPLKAVLHARDGTRSLACPGLPEERFAAHSMFVGGPYLDRRLRIRRPDRRHLLAQRVFLDACCAATSAVACRGRGR